MPKGNILLFYIFFIPFLCLAQTGQRVPVTTILERVSDTYGIKFSWVDNDLAIYTLVPPNKNLTAEDTFKYIEDRTRLKFKPEGKGRYIVYNTVSADNPFCGYIKDTQNHPVENATITISGRGEVILSGADGYFRLPMVTSATVQISSIGYKTKEVNIAAFYVPDCPTFYLEEAPIDLDEVVTEYYIASGISKKENGQVVVKPQKFGILPGLTEPDILQAMKQLPGVTSIDETVSNINVRGGTHDQNLFLWNGIRMFQTSHFFGLMSAFNPLPATSISIYKNGTPAFYSEGVSSLVDISTHSGLNDKTYNVFTADMLSANFLSAIKLSEKDRLQVSARRSYTDAFATPTYKSYRERVFQNTVITDVLQNRQIRVKTDEGFYFYDLSFSYRHTINDKHRLLVDGITLKNNLDVSQSMWQAHKQDNLSQQSLGGSITLLSQWNGNSSSEVQASVSSYNVDATHDVLESEQVTFQKNTVLDKSLRFKYSYRFSPIVALSTGYQFNEISVRNLDKVNIPEFSNDETDVLRSHVVVAEAGYTSKGGSTRLTAGLRANYFGKYSMARIEPRLVFSTQLLTGLKLELSAEMKSQTVTQVIGLQQDFLGIEKRHWVLADDKAIPVQKSTQASAGLNYTDNGWFASLEGYYKKVTGITSNSQGFQNQFEFSSGKGYYKILGVEALLQKRFGHFYSWLSYAYNDNYYHFDGFVPPEFTNNFAIPHTIACAGVYEWNKFQVALGAKWRSGTPYTVPFSFYIDPDNPANSKITYGNPNGNRLTDNFQVNASLAKAWDLGNNTLFSLGFSVQNIFDAKNSISRYYRINKDNNNVESINTYGLKRVFNINAKIIF